MNFYKKYCANTWVAATQDEFEKGDYITLTTKRGKENEHIVWNFLGKDRDGNNLYSITRADGYNLQERAKQSCVSMGGPGRLLTAPKIITLFYEHI